MTYGWVSLAAAKEKRFVCVACLKTSTDAAWIESKQCYECGGEAIPLLEWVRNKCKGVKHGDGEKPAER